MFILKYDSPCPHTKYLYLRLPFVYARLQTGCIMVWRCLSGSPSVRRSVSHSFPHFSPTCFDILSWNCVCHFLLLSFIVLYIKFECGQFASIFVGVMPLLELRILEINSFPQFYLTCFDILSCNFTYDFVIPYYRSSLSVVNLRQFLWEICPFLYTRLQTGRILRPTLRVSVQPSVTVFRTFSYIL